MVTYDAIRRRTRLWSFFVLVVSWFLMGRCFEQHAEAAVRYSETLITKASGSTNAVVLPSASVYVYNPGATASASCSGSTITVYSNTNILVNDVIEISSTGLTFTVTALVSTTGVTVSGSPTCASGDRLLRTSSPATIYYDEGATSAITQPAIASSVGKIIFFTNASGFDLKAVASNGLRVVNYGVLTGAGSAGGWTDDGTVVRLSDATDNVGVGTTSPGASVHIKGANSATLGTPSNYLFELEGSSPAQKFGIYCSSDRRCALYDITDSLDILAWGNGSGTNHPIYLGNVASAASMSNQGTLMLLQEGSAVRGIVVQRSASGSTGNLIELRDQTGTSLASWAPSGNLTAVAIAGTTGTFSDTGTTSVTGAGRVTGSTFYATTAAATPGLVLPGPAAQIKINGDVYTWPADYPTTSAYHLASTTAGILSWDPSVAGCAGAYTTVAIPMPAHQMVTEGVITPGTAYCSMNTAFHYYDNGFGPVSRWYGCSATQTDVDDFYSPPGSGAQSISMWAKADANVGAGASVTVNVQSDASDVGSTCTMAAGASVCTGPTNQSFSLASGHKWNLKIVVSGTASIGELLVTYCFGL